MFSEFPNFYVTGKLAEVLCNLLCTFEWEDRERKDSISAKISSCLSSTFLHSSQGHHRTLHNCLMEGLLFSDFVCGCWSTTESLLTHNSKEETTALASLDTVGIKGEGRPTGHSHLRARGATYYFRPDFLCRWRAWQRATVLESLWQYVVSSFGRGGCWAS